MCLDAYVVGLKDGSVCVLGREIVEIGGKLLLGGDWGGLRVVSADVSPSNPTYFDVNRRLRGKRIKHFPHAMTHYVQRVIQ